jgi:hypothetical protein
MRAQSAEDVIELVDLGAACKETREVAPFFMRVDSMYAWMSWQP